VARDELGKRVAFFLIQDRKRHAETSKLLKEPDFAAEWQPAAFGKLNQEGNYFSHISCAPGVYKTSMSTKVFDPTVMTARKTVPLGREVYGDALVCPSVFGAPFSSSSVFHHDVLQTLANMN